MRRILLFAVAVLAVTPVVARSTHPSPSPRPEPKTLPIVNLNGDGTFLGLVKPPDEDGSLIGKSAETGTWASPTSSGPAGAHFSATISAHDSTHTLLNQEGLGAADVLGDNSSSAPQGRQAKIMLVLPTEQ